MRPTMADVDIGPCRARSFDLGADRWAILLPGASYSTDAPLLWFAREAALAADRNVLAVRDTFDGSSDPSIWAEQRAQAALHHVRSGDTLLVAKSVTSLAAPLAARQRLPAVWLTPLIGGEASVSGLVVGGLADATAPCLLVGGTADSTWNAQTARTFAAAEVLEIAGADHLLQIPGDPPGSIDALQRVTEAISRFLASTGWPPVAAEPAGSTGD